MKDFNLFFRVFFLVVCALPCQAAVTYKTASDWGSGFNGEIDIVNDSASPLANWTVEFDFAPALTSIWNGVIKSKVGTHYVLAPASWNGEIAVGGTVAIGFGGAPGNITAGPQNLKLNGASVPVTPPVVPPVTPPANPVPATGITVAVVKTSQWSGGFGANLVITNGTSSPVNNWTLGFNFDQVITSLWNGTFKQIGNQYSVTNLDWNAAIPVGGNVSIGINGNGTISSTSATNCMFNGSACTLSFSTVATPPSTAQAIVISQIDSATPALWFTVPQGVSSYALSLANPATASFSVLASNANVTAAIVSNSLQVNGVAAGRASLKITDSISGVTRFVGVRVKNADGSLPGMPKYLSLGSVSEDTTPDLSFWQSFQPGGKNKQVDIRYIYLNGGPVTGWDTWGNNSGDRATTYIRNSHQLGMIPFFVFYNIADGGESYYTDLAHVQDATYVAAYFKNLKLALDIINKESPDDVVGMILEPDFLGYLAQNSGQPASAVAAMTHGAYDSGVLTRGVDPAFPDNVQGLVKAINYTISKNAKQVYFGWQMNLWASPAGGWTTPVPGKGLMHKTETSGITAGRAQIYNEAAAITQYYVNAGVLTSGANFVSVDKYGLDATGFEASAAQDPASSYWFWNSDLWQNYLTFVKAMHDTAKLPVILWQLPVGHINSSQRPNPYTGGLFPDLANNNRMLEDSAPVFFLGDTFKTTGARNLYFSANLSGDRKLSVTGDSITWGSHLADAASAGVVSVLFGAGVGASTAGTGNPPTDNYWWITGVQSYYSQKIPLP